MVASSYIHDKHDCWIRFVMEWFWTLATRNVAKSSYCETFVLPGRYVEYIYTKLTPHASWKIKLEKIMSQAKQLYLPPYMLMLRLPSLLSSIALKHSNWLCTHVHIYCWWMATPLCGHILLVSYYTTELWDEHCTCKSLRTASQWSLICQCASRNCFHRVYSGSKLDIVTIVQ